MDQAKWACPRDRLIQRSKEANGLLRPRMKVQAVWIHGIALNLYLVHPCIPADSSLVIECFQKALQDCIDRFESLGQPLPSTCFAWVS